VLTACEESGRSNEAPILLGPPEEFVKYCPRPVKLPDRSLTQFEVENSWIQDRASLVLCADRHAAVTEFYEDRDSRILAQ
jgi:hypothetical protein